MIVEAPREGSKRSKGTGKVSFARTSVCCVRRTCVYTCSPCEKRLHTCLGAGVYLCCNVVSPPSLFFAVLCFVTYDGSIWDVLKVARERLDVGAHV